MSQAQLGNAADGVTTAPGHVVIAEYESEYVVRPDNTYCQSGLRVRDIHTSASPATTGHTFAAAGNYTATLTVTDSDGRTAHVTQQVVVKADEPPTAAVAVTSPASIVGQSTAFSGSGSNDPDGTISTYL